MDTVSDRKTAIEAYLRAVAGALRVEIQALAPMSGGAIQENWHLQADVLDGPYAGGLDLVLRTDAPSAVSVSRTRSEEYRLLCAAASAGVTVPEPLWLCEDLDVIGRPFFLMRRVEGMTSPKDLVNGGPGVDQRMLTRRLGAELARIHAIQPPREDLAFLPFYSESPALRLILNARDYLDTLPTPHPVIELGLRWLERNAPPRGRIVLCHRDFRTGNYMVNSEGLTGILDWEFAGWSDPLEDIGWFCAKCWRFGAVDREAGGVGTRHDFYEGYEEVADRNIPQEEVHYWEVMAHVNWALIAINQAERTRTEPSLLLGLTGHIVPELEYEILRLTEAA